MYSTMGIKRRDYACIYVCILLHIARYMLVSRLNVVVALVLFFLRFLACIININVHIIFMHSYSL